MGRTRINTRVRAGDLLKHETLIGNDDFFLHIMRQFATIVSPGDFVGGGTGSYGAFEIDVIALLDVGGVEVGPQA